MHSRARLIKVIKIISQAKLSFQVVTEASYEAFSLFLFFFFLVYLNICEFSTDPMGKSELIFLDETSIIFFFISFFFFLAFSCYMI